MSGIFGTNTMQNNMNDLLGNFIEVGFIPKTNGALECHSFYSFESQQEPQIQRTIDDRKRNRQFFLNNVQLRVDLNTLLPNAECDSMNVKNIKMNLQYEQ